MTESGPVTRRSGLSGTLQGRAAAAARHRHRDSDGVTLRVPGPGRAGWPGSRRPESCAASETEFTKLYEYYLTGIFRRRDSVVRVTAWHWHCTVNLNLRTVVRPWHSHIDWHHRQRRPPVSLRVCRTVAKAQPGGGRDTILRLQLASDWHWQSPGPSPWLY